MYVTYILHKLSIQGVGVVDVSCIIYNMHVNNTEIYYFIMFKIGQGRRHRFSSGNNHRYCYIRECNTHYTVSAGITIRHYVYVCV